MKNLFLAAVLLLAGCSLQPTYERPALPVTGAYPHGAAYEHGKANTDTAAADIEWRDFLKDPRLQRLVEVALANNRDLRVAVLNVEASRAQLRVQRSFQYPSVDASASHTASRTPPGQTAGGNAVQSRYYSAGIDVSWDLDFFGRLRSLSDAAFQQYLASDQGRRAEQILLVSQVADQYLAILADDELLAITRGTLRTAQGSYDLARAQFDAGTGNELSLRQAETVVEQAQASLAALVRTRAQDENALVLLLGAPMPADLPTPLALDAQVLTDVPAGLPSDLLVRRPDIMQAEASLRAANANIGAARAAFFPSIDLTGSYGAASTALSGLFHGAASAWSFIPMLTMPIFEGGRLQASLDLAKVQKEINVAQYEKSIQSAFTEVANGLAARGTYDDQVAALTRLVAADQRTLDLSTMRFRTGIDSYLNVLTAQTQLYAAQQLLVTARLARLTNRVDLYRALGGGWVDAEKAQYLASLPVPGRVSPETRAPDRGITTP